MKTKAELEAELRILQAEVAELENTDRLQKRINELEARKKELNPRHELPRKVAKAVGKVAFATGYKLGGALKDWAKWYQANERKSKKRKDEYTI